MENKIQILERNIEWKCIVMLRASCFKIQHVIDPCINQQQCGSIEKCEHHREFQLYRYCSGSVITYFQITIYMCHHVNVLCNQNWVFSSWFPILTKCYTEKITFPFSQYPNIILFILVLQELRMALYFQSQLW